LDTSPPLISFAVIFLLLAVSMQPMEPQRGRPRLVPVTASHDNREQTHIRKSEALRPKVGTYCREAGQFVGERTVICHRELEYEIRANHAQRIVLSGEPSGWNSTNSFKGRQPKKLQAHGPHIFSSGPAQFLGIMNTYGTWQQRNDAAKRRM
jgi:hypothetical protein